MMRHLWKSHMELSLDLECTHVFCKSSNKFPPCEKRIILQCPRNIFSKIFLVFSSIAVTPDTFHNLRRRYRFVFRGSGDGQFGEPRRAMVSAHLWRQRAFAARRNGVVT